MMWSHCMERREKFYDAEDKDQDSPEVQEEIPAAAPQSLALSRGNVSTSESTLVPHLTNSVSNRSSSKPSSKERGQTDFMMILRRPKPRMPYF
ncbi:hypothetical protein Dimus_022548 [Dionaea muscipula]